MRHVYLAATGQNRGKTTVSLGVLDGFLRRGLSASFLKPVGQRTVIEDGVAADEDAVLMKQVFGLREPLGQMSPVHIPRGFTQAYIEGDVVEDLPARIRAAHAAFITDAVAWSVTAAARHGVRLRLVNAGGGLGVLCTGDRIRIDLVNGTADMLVPDDELAHRRADLDAAGGFPMPASQTPWQEIQRSMVDQLADGGRMVIPVNSTMLLVTRDGDDLDVTEHGGYRFVPLR